MYQDGGKTSADAVACAAFYLRLATFAFNQFATAGNGGPFGAFPRPSPGPPAATVATQPYLR